MAAPARADADAVEEATALEEVFDGATTLDVGAAE